MAVIENITSNADNNLYEKKAASTQHMRRRRSSSKEAKRKGKHYIPNAHNLSYSYFHAPKQNTMYISHSKNTTMPKGPTPSELFRFHLKWKETTTPSIHSTEEEERPTTYIRGLYKNRIRMTQFSNQQHRLYNTVVCKQLR